MRGRWVCDGYLVCLDLCVDLPGISNWKDAVEFMLAGATAIQIGTYNFVDPAVGIKVIEGMNDYCDRHGFSSVRELIGALEV